VEANPVAGNGSAVHRSVVSKVAAILRTFRFGGALTVSEIAQMTELPLSTAHRLVVELADWQLLRRGDDGRYGLHLGGDTAQRPMPLRHRGCGRADRRRSVLGDA
jgi:hypothetical protein